MSTVKYEIRREQGASGTYWYSLYIDGHWERFYFTKFGARRAIKQYIKSKKKKDKYETFLEQYDENGERIK